MDVRVGPQRKLSAKELMLLNCGIGEDSSESLGQQGNETSFLRVPWTARRSNQSILKDFFGRNDAKAETPVLWLPHDVKS